jgi:hypothetical protein
MADVKKWKDRHGKEHSIKDMTSDYIKNCIKTLEKNGTTSRSVYIHLKEELESREPKIKKKFKFIAKD